MAERFPLRDFVTEELEARGWSRAYFSYMSGYGLDLVNAWLDGKVDPTPAWDELPLALALTFETSLEFWSRLAFRANDA